MIDIKDRLVEHPNRFKLIAVPGMEGVYDLIPHPGEVTEEGTAVNKALFNDLQSDIPIGSFLAFAGNVNSDMLDAAFGKGNEDRMVGLGRQLAMYAWFKGEDEAHNKFTHLSKANTLLSILDDHNSLGEFLGSSSILQLLNASPYATGVSKAYIPFAPSDDHGTIINASTNYRRVNPSNVFTLLGTVTVPSTGYYKIKGVVASFLASTIGFEYKFIVNNEVIKTFSETGNSDGKLYSKTVDDVFLKMGDVVKLEMRKTQTGTRDIVFGGIVLLADRKLGVPNNTLGDIPIWLSNSLLVPKESTSSLYSNAFICPKSGTYRLKVCFDLFSSSVTDRVFIQKNNMDVLSVRGDDSIDLALTIGDEVRVRAVRESTSQNTPVEGLLVCCGDNPNIYPVV